MVEGVKNLNPPVIQPKPKATCEVGLLTPPDSHYKPVLYSSREAEKSFNQLNRDVYQQLKQTRPEDKHKMPKSVYAVLIGAILTPPVIFLIRKLIKK
jgi:hypothetical protein